MRYYYYGNKICLTKEENEEISNVISDVLYNARNLNHGIYMLPYYSKKEDKLIIEIVHLTSGITDTQYGLLYTLKSNKDISIEFNYVNPGNYGVSQMKPWDINFAKSIANGIILKDDIRGDLSSIKESYKKYETNRYNKVIFEPALNYKTFEMDEDIKYWLKKQGYYTKQDKKQEEVVVKTKRRGRK